MDNKDLKKIMIEICEILKIEVNNFDQFWYKLMQDFGLEIKLSNLGIEKQDLELIVDSVNIERLRNHPINFGNKILTEGLNSIF